MAKDARLVRDPHQKEIVKLFSAFDGSKNRRKIFEDFITMTACMISNTCDPVHVEEREKLYMQFASQYKPNELDVFARMIAEIVNGLEDNPDQDFLGEMYMALEFGSSSAGQFFTPYSVCRCTAALASDFDVLKAKIAEKGFVSVTDPACGAGALLMAFANAARAESINYQTQCLFIAQDIDFTVGCMCYIAMSLMGCPGYVVIGDTLCNPNVTWDRRGLLPVDDCGRIWYTPTFMTTELWMSRRACAMMDLSIRRRREGKPQKTNDPTTTKRQPDPDPEVADPEAGQLMFF